MVETDPEGFLPVWKHAYFKCIVLIFNVIKPIPEMGVGEVLIEG